MHPTVMLGQRQLVDYLAANQDWEVDKEWPLLELIW